MNRLTVFSPSHTRSSSSSSLSPSSPPQLTPSPSFPSSSLSSSSLSSSSSSISSITATRFSDTANLNRIHNRGNRRPPSLSLSNLDFGLANSLPTTPPVTFTARRSHRSFPSSSYSSSSSASSSSSDVIVVISPTGTRHQHHEENEEQQPLPRRPAPLDLSLLGDAVEMEDTRAVSLPTRHQYGYAQRMTERQRMSLSHRPPTPAMPRQLVMLFNNPFAPMSPQSPVRVSESGVVFN